MLRSLNLAVFGLSLFSVFEAEAGLLDRLEASVNSELILRSDISHFRRTVPLRKQLDPLFQGTQVEKHGRKASNRQIVNFLINEKVILSKFPVSKQEVEDEIRKIQTNNRVSREALISALKAQGFVFDDYFQLIKSSVAKKKLIDSEIRSKVSVSDDDVKNYFYNQYEGKKTARSYRIQIITVEPDKHSSGKEALEIAQQALNDIQGGESFAKTAKKYSDSPNAEEGGDLGFLSSENISPTIAKELKNLKVGQTSKILGGSDTQYFIIRLADIKSGEDEKLKQLKEKIRAQLLAKEFQQQIHLWIDRERQNAFVRVAGDPSIPKAYAK